MTPDLRAVAEARMDAWGVTLAPRRVARRLCQGLSNHELGVALRGLITEGASGGSA